MKILFKDGYLHTIQRNLNINGIGIVSNPLQGKDFKQIASQMPQKNRQLDIFTKIV